MAILAGIQWAHAQSITYTQIANVSTTVPGSTGTFSGLGDITLDGNNVAFVGLSNGNSTSGIYTSTVSGLSLSKVADNTTIATDSGNSMTGTLSNLSNPNISGATVAFRGTTNGVTGIYTGTLGTVGGSLVAQPGDPAPEPHEKFSSTFAPSVSGTHVAFFANYINDGTGGVTGSGIYTGTAGLHSTPVALSDRLTPISGHTINSYGSTISADGDYVTFRGSYAGGGGGIYVEKADGSSQTLIADNTTSLPDGTGTFSLGLALPVISGSNVAFSTGQGVYLKDATGIHTIADSNTPVPGMGVNFSPGGFSTNISLDGGNVAFIAAYSGGSGLFLEYNGNILPVVTNSSTLFGDPVYFYNITNEALDGNNLAFNYTVNGSSGPTAVAVATIGAVPEPSAWTSLLGGAGLFAMGRRFRKRDARSR